MKCSDFNEFIPLKKVLVNYITTQNPKKGIGVLLILKNQVIIKLPKYKSK